MVLRYLNRFGPSRIKRLITLGTPYLGTPGAFKTLEKGDFVDGILGYFLQSSFVELFRNQRSWYELLPTRVYFELVSPAYISAVSQKPVRGYRQTTAFIKNRPWANQQLLDELQGGLGIKQKLKLLKEIDAYFIIGEQQPTTGGIRCEPGPPLDCSALPANGDGAVVLQSAQMGSQLASIHPGHLYYITEHHGQLFNNPTIMTQVVNILGGKLQPVPSVSRQPNKKEFCS